MKQDELDLIIKNHQLWLSSNGMDGHRANFDNQVVGDNHVHQPQGMSVRLRRGGGIEAVGGIAIVNGQESKEHVPSHFTGLNFREADLRGALFGKALFYDCDMSNVNFAGCDLTSAKFAKVNLMGAQLGGLFEKACSLRGVVFNHCKFANLFLQRADFSGSDLSKSEFNNSKFYSCKFDHSVANGTNFSDANLSDSSFRNCSLNESNFDGAKLKGCDLSHTSVRFASFEGANVCDVVHKLDSFKLRVKNAFGALDHSKHIGCRCVTMFGNERLKKVIQEEAFVEEFAQSNPTLYKLWLLTSDCGRSMILWLALSTILVFLFSSAFYFIGSEGFVFNEQISLMVEAGDFFPFVYYSVVTFTTLGFGDITPISSMAMGLVIFEVIVGFVMLGLLISILTNKVASRS